MSKIPPFDLSEQYKIIGDEVNAAVLAVLASGRYIGGDHVEGFEQQFAAYIDTSECIACNSGTDALFLALRALHIGPGDEVITTPFTFIATAEVISAVGATPVFVDIEAYTFNLNLDQVEAAITERTRAIMPVHLFGQPVEMPRLMAIAQQHQLTVVEDCAQAVGAEWADQKVGGIGHIGCFSFYPTKNLGACGDGGAVTTNDPEIAATIRMLRDHGRRAGGYYHEAIGVNSRLDALQAAILQVKLRYLDTWNSQRRAVADRYRHLLQHVPGIVLPQEPVGGKGVWNQYTLRIPSTDQQTEQDQHCRRDQVRQHLQADGVSSMVYYPLPLHLQPIYQAQKQQLGQHLIAEQAANEVLSLPMFPELSPDVQDRVVYSLKDCLAGVIV
ncbi:DegT/DnrJ/EryC1/StrS family aminotransferase [Stenomitos frigidus]|uniref:Cys/Met metabolism pyridoxal-phosphate-dependent enzyme n=1 Tax=Stenomitos frigidus ULC18 TaxID=2107698 RepID=A0A2T1EPQ1_9CYAN|nr:DegT/DnrJ/EryC1/StrS family aminotransferase [Stenomitos frigidus]PSB34704.1 Cys/Met metabolism pyridoxal-phosphate-dependent enzyme [Stenomitos frigidus ULC18]